MRAYLLSCQYMRQDGMVSYILYKFYKSRACFSGGSFNFFTYLMEAAKLVNHKLGGTPGQNNKELNMTTRHCNNPILKKFIWNFHAASEVESWTMEWTKPWRLTIKVAHPKLVSYWYLSCTFNSLLGCPCVSFCVLSSPVAFKDPSWGTQIDTAVISFILHLAVRKRNKIESLNENVLFIAAPRKLKHPQNEPTKTIYPTWFEFFP